MVIWPVYPALAKDDREELMNPASSEAVVCPPKMASLPTTMSSTRDHCPHAISSVT